VVVVAVRAPTAAAATATATLATATTTTAAAAATATTATATAAVVGGQDSRRIFAAHGRQSRSAGGSIHRRRPETEDGVRPTASAGGRSRRQALAVDRVASGA